MKKAFIFSMDAFLAIVLFVLIIFLIYTFSISLSGLNQQYFFSDDILTALSEVKISELDPNNYKEIDALKIKDPDATIVEQIVTFQQNAKMSSYGVTVINDIISKINKNMNTAIYISDSLIYGTDPRDIVNIITRTRLAVGKK
jgi:hypothetical protein